MSRGTGNCSSTHAQTRGSVYRGPLTEVSHPWNAPEGDSVCPREDGTLLLISRRRFASGANMFIETRAVFSGEEELRQALGRRDACTVVDDATLDQLVLGRLRAADRPQIAWALTRWLADRGYFAGDSRKHDLRVSRSLQRLKKLKRARFGAGGWEATVQATVPSAPSAAELAERFELLYHVPRSQVWEGSRGRQSGNTHLHVREERFDVGRIHRTRGQALCGRSAWYARPPEFPSEFADFCPRCAEIAARGR